MTGNLPVRVFKTRGTIMSNHIAYQLTALANRLEDIERAADDVAMCYQWVTQHDEFSEGGIRLREQLHEAIERLCKTRQSS
jgi:hypothetical protein